MRVLSGFNLPTSTFYSPEHGVLCWAPSHTPRQTASARKRAMPECITTSEWWALTWDLHHRPLLPPVLLCSIAVPSNSCSTVTGRCAWQLDVPMHKDRVCISAVCCHFSEWPCNSVIPLSKGHLQVVCYNIHISAPTALPVYASVFLFCCVFTWWTAFLKSIINTLCLPRTVSTIKTNLRNQQESLHWPVWWLHKELIALHLPATLTPHENTFQTLAGRWRKGLGCVICWCRWAELSSRCTWWAARCN